MYNGWNFYDILNIYLYKNKKEDDFYLGKIAGANNKKENERIKKKLALVSYEVITLENKNFHCNFLKGPKHYYNGNLASVINCLITKNTTQFQVQIDIDNWFSVINQSKIVNGSVEENLYLVKKEGKVYLIHENMNEYTEIIADKELKEAVKHKTIKHKIGHNYYNLYENQIYIGDIYLWYTKNIDITTGHSFPTTFYIDPMENPNKIKVYIKTEAALKLLNGSNKLSDLVYNTIDFFMEDKTEERNESLKESGINKQYLLNIEEKEKATPLTEGNIVLENDICQKDLQLLLNARKEFFKYKHENNGWGLPIDIYIYSAFNDKMPIGVTKEEKKSLNNNDYYKYVFC